MNSSPLYKKKISVNGDSICEGVGFAGGYVKLIADRNCMEYQNLGIGGGTVSAEVVTPAGTKRHCISRTVDNMDPDADYAIVEGGVNDASMNELYGYPSFGELTEGYNGPFDDKTYIGAFEEMLKKLIVKYQGKKIGYIAVHQCAGKYRPTYAGEDNFYRAALAVCRKWGVPYLDLTASTPPIAYLRTKLGADPVLDTVSASFTKENDGTHPNEAGYLAFYCDRIEAWLKTL